MAAAVVVPALVSIAYLMVGDAKIAEDLSESPVYERGWTHRPSLKRRIVLVLLWPIRWRVPLSTFGARLLNVMGDLFLWAVVFGVLAFWFWLSGKLGSSLILRLVAASVVTFLTSFVWGPLAFLLSLPVVYITGLYTMSVLKRRGPG